MAKWQTELNKTHIKTNQKYRHNHKTKYIYFPFIDLIHPQNRRCDRIVEWQTTFLNDGKVTFQSHSVCAGKSQTVKKKHLALLTDSINPGFYHFQAPALTSLQAIRAKVKCFVLFFTRSLALSLPPFISLGRHLLFLDRGQRLSSSVCRATAKAKVMGGVDTSLFFSYF